MFKDFLSVFSGLAISSNSTWPVSLRYDTTRCRDVLFRACWTARRDSTARHARHDTTRTTCMTTGSSHNILSANIVLLETDLTRWQGLLLQVLLQLSTTDNFGPL